MYLNSIINYKINRNAVNTVTIIINRRYHTALIRLMSQIPTKVPTTKNNTEDNNDADKEFELCIIDQVPNNGTRNYTHDTGWN